MSRQVKEVCAAGVHILDMGNNMGIPLGFVLIEDKVLCALVQTRCLQLFGCQVIHVMSVSCFITLNVDSDDTVGTDP